MDRFLPPSSMHEANAQNMPHFPWEHIAGTVGYPWIRGCT